MSFVHATNGQKAGAGISDRANGNEMMRTRKGIVDRRLPGDSDMRCSSQVLSTANEPAGGGRGSEKCADRFLDGGEESALTKAAHQPEPLQLLLDGILHLGEAHADPGGAQRIVEVADGVSRRDIDAGD